MQQVANIENIFRSYFAQAITPDRIIEFGTGFGEFTHLVYRLRKEINDDFDFITIDQWAHIKDIPPNMTFYHMSIFSDIKFVADLIKDKTLLLCDNGNKVLEVRTFAPYLKEYCVIMAHDYSQNKFTGNKDWWCCEITWDDISDLGLVPYYQELMITGGWASLIPDK